MEWMLVNLNAKNFFNVMSAAKADADEVQCNLSLKKVFVCKLKRSATSVKVAKRPNKGRKIETFIKFQQIFYTSLISFKKQHRFTKL
jgi:hypothetical protein